MVGAPQAIASAAGKPKPSYSDGNTKSPAAWYTGTRSSSSTALASRTSRGHPECPQPWTKRVQLGTSEAGDDQELVPPPQILRQSGVGLEQNTNVFSMVHGAGIEDVVRSMPGFEAWTV